jgi:hypothetical protein
MAKLDSLQKALRGVPAGKKKVVLERIAERLPDFYENVRDEVVNEIEAKQQDELYAAYQAEMRQLQESGMAGHALSITEIRKKYRDLGLDV